MRMGRSQGGVPLGGLRRGRNLVGRGQTAFLVLWIFQGFIMFPHHSQSQHFAGQSFVSHAILYINPGFINSGSTFNRLRPQRWVRRIFGQ